MNPFVSGAHAWLLRPCRARGSLARFFRGFAPLTPVYVSMAPPGPRLQIGSDRADGPDLILLSYRLSAGGARDSRSG